LDHKLNIVDEILGELVRTQYLSSLDMTTGYHKIKMGLHDEYKTVFKSHHVHYQFRVMSFGLTNAPASFQCVMNSILEPYFRKFVMVFMNSILEPYFRKFVMVFIDDILICSADMLQHLEHWRLVFSTLRAHHFYLKRKKCLCQTSVTVFRPYYIQGWVSTDPTKTQAMVDWPVTPSITELRGFLGLTSYYSKFVRNYGVIAKPLLTTLLQRKRIWVWTEEAQQAFEKPKQAMTQTPVLTLPNFELPFCGGD
jgi:hypothetical protein